METYLANFKSSTVTQNTESCNAWASELVSQYKWTSAWSNSGLISVETVSFTISAHSLRATFVSKKFFSFMNIQIIEPITRINHNQILPKLFFIREP